MEPLPLLGLRGTQLMPAQASPDAWGALAFSRLIIVECMCCGGSAVRVECMASV